MQAQAQDAVRLDLGWRNSLAFPLRGHRSPLRHGVRLCMLQVTQNDATARRSGRVWRLWLGDIGTTIGTGTKYLDIFVSVPEYSV